MKTMYGNVEVSKIVVDEEMYPRSSYDWKTAYSYSQSMKMGANFPPIAIGKLGDGFVLIDGKHRLEAVKTLLGAKAFKETKIKCEILIGLNKRQMFEEAIKRNIVHGKGFSVQDKLLVASKLKVMGYTIESVSKLVQIPLGQLKNLQVRRVVNTITGEDVILKREFVSPTIDIKPKNAGAISVVQTTFRGNSQLTLLDELIALIETHSLDIKNKAVAAKVAHLKKLLRHY